MPISGRERRFIIMHKTDAYWEGGALPDSNLIARVGALLGQLSSAGLLQAGEGLRPSAEGVRLRFAGGECDVVPGPFGGGNELPASFSILRTASLDEAVEWATREAEILGDVEIDIRPVSEPWDIGLDTRPPNLSTRRYMVLRKATAETEAGVNPSPAARSRLSQLIEESTRTGLHLGTETMAPSRKGRRYKNSSNGVTFFDGPMVETKELLGGYIIITAASLEDACRWAREYINVVGAEEVDVRELE